MALAAGEFLFIILIVLFLGVVLWQVFGRPGSAPRPGAPVVRLVRAPRAPDGREQTTLTVNDRVIFVADNEGLRATEFADQLEQLEAAAARLAAALGVSVEFARAGAPTLDEEAGIPMGDLPPVTDEEIARLEARPRSASDASSR